MYDVQQSIDSIYEYLGEQRDFFEYERNKQLRRAVERELEIIGGAVNHLLALDSSIAIDNARRIVGLRNFVIHGYDKVDNVIIWGFNFIRELHYNPLKIRVSEALPK